MIVERWGRFHRQCNAGLHFLMPFADQPRTLTWRDYETKLQGNRFVQHVHQGTEGAQGECGVWVGGRESDRIVRTSYYMNAGGRDEVLLYPWRMPEIAGCGGTITIVLRTCSAMSCLGGAGRVCPHQSGEGRGVTSVGIDNRTYIPFLTLPPRLASIVFTHTHIVSLVVSLVVSPIVTNDAQSK